MTIEKIIQIILLTAMVVIFIWWTISSIKQKKKMLKFREMESKGELFIYDEVIELIIEERRRAVMIADEFKDKNYDKFIEQQNVENLITLIAEDVSEECRYISNAISGINTLSVALDETMEDRVLEDLEKRLFNK